MIRFFFFANGATWMIPVVKSYHVNLKTLPNVRKSANLLHLVKQKNEIEEAMHDEAWCG
jgi:hypothetical protein